MKKIIKFTIIFCIVSIAFLFLLSIFGPDEINNKNPIARYSMLKTTLEWGRLAPIPDSKTDFDIYTEGSSFTRAFHCSFYLPKKDLKKWIKESPGLRDAKVSKINGAKIFYMINPGGGAQHAEATIDKRKCYVKIYVYWS